MSTPPDRLGVFGKEPKRKLLLLQAFLVFKMMSDISAGLIGLAG